MRQELRQAANDAKDPELATVLDSSAAVQLATLAILAELPTKLADLKDAIDDLAAALVTSKT